MSQHDLKIINCHESLGFDVLRNQIALTSRIRRPGKFPLARKHILDSGSLRYMVV